VPVYVVWVCGSGAFANRDKEGTVGMFLSGFVLSCLACSCEWIGLWDMLVGGGWWVVSGECDADDGRRGFLLAVDSPTGHCLPCAPHLHTALLRERSSCALHVFRPFVLHSWFLFSQIAYR
jgi:hypothetical protein